MRPIRATYRLQLAPGFDLASATAIVPYLARLGVSHVHLSPVYEARPGSTHGYDVTDPGAVRAELGGRAALDGLLRTLAAHGMGAVLDVVPNHMAADAANRRWTELLRHGPAAPSARWFDVNWRAGPGHEPRVLVPILGERLGTVLEQDELRLVWEDGRIQLAYWNHRFPLDPSTLVPLLEDAARRCDEHLSAADPRCAELREITALLRRLPGRGAREPRALARRIGGTSSSRPATVARKPPSSTIIAAANPTAESVPSRPGARPLSTAARNCRHPRRPIRLASQ
jgi:(1->4)-alpha-D-glucan 1-alpha-D-glucosylmutase